MELERDRVAEEAFGNVDYGREPLYHSTCTMDVERFGAVWTLKHRKAVEA